MSPLLVLCLGRWLQHAAALEVPGRSCTRIVAIGDLHGDLDHTLRVAKAARIINDTVIFDYSNDRGLCVVQLGDLVDRGDYGKDLYDLWRQWREQSGGAVMNLMGNHELMNLLDDFRYVSPGDNKRWGGEATRTAAWRGDWGDDIIEQYHAAHRLNSTVFFHAGILPEHVPEGGDIAVLNTKVKKAIRTLRRTESTQNYFAYSPLLRDEGPLWTRDLAMGPEKKACRLVKESLKELKAARMVVGHSQVTEGRVKARCGGRLLMIDTIISKAGYPFCWNPDQQMIAGCRGSLSYLEIKGNRAEAVEVAATGAIEVVSRVQLPSPTEVAFGNAGALEL